MIVIRSLILFCLFLSVAHIPVQADDCINELRQFFQNNTNPHKFSVNEIADIEDAMRSSNLTDNYSLPDKGHQEGTKIVELENGIKVVWKPDNEEWSSNYKAEVLAFKLNQALGLDNVPITVVKEVDGQIGSAQHFVKGAFIDQVEFVEEGQIQLQSIFDYIIDQRDRNLGNFLISPEGKVYSIDNGIAFTGVEGYEKKSFMDIEGEVREELASPEGQELISQAKKLLEDNDFFLQAQSYIDDKDIDRLKERLSFLIEYNDFQLQGKSLNMFVEEIMLRSDLSVTYLSEIFHYYKNNEKNFTILTEKIELLLSALKVKKLDIYKSYLVSEVFEIIYQSPMKFSEIPGLVLKILKANKGNNHNIAFSVFSLLRYVPNPDENISLIFRELLTSESYDDSVYGQMLSYISNLKNPLEGTSELLKEIIDINSHDKVIISTAKAIEMAHYPIERVDTVFNDLIEFSLDDLDLLNSILDSLIYTNSQVDGIEQIISHLLESAYWDMDILYKIIKHQKELESHGGDLAEIIEKAKEKNR